MPPFNDNITAAFVVNADGSYSHTTVGATNEGSGPGSEDNQYNDVAVWYRLEWSSTGKWRIRVNNVTPIFFESGYDTYVSFGSSYLDVTSDPPGGYSDLTFASSDFDSPRSSFSGQGYNGTSDVAQTTEHNAGYVLYLRFGSSQTSGFPYTQWTGTYDIEFEFITPPYNSGSTPPNDDMQNAILLDVDDSTTGTTHGATEDAGTVWYRWEPATDMTLKVTVEGTENNGWFPFGDMYHVDGSDPPTSYGDLSNDGWYAYLGDRDPATGLPLNPGYAVFELKGGEVYVMEVYDYEGIFNSDFTITSESNSGPSNDMLQNATVISPSVSWPKVLTGTTINGSQGITETINWDGSMTPSVWYLLDNQGPGAMSVVLESLTDDWIAQFETFYKTSDHTQAGVVEMDDLTEDGSQTHGDTRDMLDLSKYSMYYGFETNDPSSSAYDWDPLEGGEKFYIRISGYNGDGQYDAGNFKLTVFVAPPAVCLDAVDYINGASTTASIVSGNVRETQLIPQDHGGISPYPKLPWSGWIDEQVATLIIPGEDIADSPGMYAAQIKHKNTTDAFDWVVGFRRNGQPFEPGAEMNADSDSTPTTEWITMMAGAPHPNEIDMPRYIPIQPGDEIQIVVSNNSYNDVGEFLDVYQVCFQRLLNAVEAAPYSQLTIPDYPMGTVQADLGTNDQQGDLMIYKDTPSAGDYTGHRSTNADLVVTDDGTLWCVARWMCTGGVSDGLTIGPALMKWTGSAWSVVNDDVFGLGVKRTQVRAEGWSLSMDTDGEDIWVVTGVDVGPPGGVVTQHSTFLKVRKYDVSGNSWSDVGSPFHGSHSHVGGTSFVGDWTPAEAGDFGETPILRVSPNGVPWVSFTDAYAPAGNELDMPFFQTRAYVARWTGSTWDVDVLPAPYESDDTYNITFWDESNGSLGGTASTTTYLGVACITDSQTSPTNDTLSFTPPAGQWSFKWRTAKDHISGGTTGYELRAYKNGTLLGGFTWPQSSALTTSDIGWGRGFWSDIWVDCNGSDVISIRIYKTGTGVANIYLDYVAQADAHRILENSGFGVGARFVDDGQPQTMLYMHQVGETGKGENPGVLYATSYTRPFLSEAERDAATPPIGYESMEILDENTGGQMWKPAETDGNYLWNWQTWVYCEWNGSNWVKKWNQLIEEGAPNHTYVDTLFDGIASTPPVGHFQQGFGGDTDGQYNYMTANLGGGQAFGFFGDTIVALRIGEEGFEPFTDGPPGALQGSGYPQGVVFGSSGFSGWGWDTGGRSIHVDTNENVWLAWNGTEGATFNYSEFVAVAGKEGVSARLAGMPGWYAAADENESLGYDNTYMPVGHVVSSPNGDTVYILFDSFIWGDPTPPNEPYTFGVYECPVLEDNKIPLIAIFPGGMAVRVYPDGRYEVIEAQFKTVRVEPSGQVTLADAASSKMVRVAKDGTVKVLT